MTLLLKVEFERVGWDACPGTPLGGQCFGLPPSPHRLSQTLPAPRSPCAFSCQSTLCWTGILGIHQYPQKQEVRG